jgi:phosphatidate cytidylyltransferase
MNAQVASAGAGRWRDLGVRVASACVLIPVVLLDVWLGDWWFTGFVALLMGLVAREYVRLALDGDGLQLGLHVAAALCATLGLVLWGPVVALSGIAVLWAMSLALLVRGPGFGVFAALGIGYVAVPGLALLLLRAQAGAVSIYWLFCVIWLADTAAYFAGRVIGGPKLWPAVSPKKTWAGLLGAIAGAMIAALVVHAGAGLAIGASMLLAAALLAVIEQGGDLYESALKRRAGVKDSGSLIPGHGGVMDRVDGLLAAGPATLFFYLNGWLVW